MINKWKHSGAVKLNVKLIAGFLSQTESIKEEKFYLHFSITFPASDRAEITAKENFTHLIAANPWINYFQFKPFQDLQLKKLCRNFNNISQGRRILI